MKLRDRVTRLEAQVKKLQELISLSHSSNKLDGVKEWLSNIIDEEGENGAIPADVIQELARDRGIGGAMLRRAKKALGINSIKDGRDWLWEK